MGRLKIKRVQSATLVETIVALVIILLLTGITVTIFVQITSTGYSSQKLKADLLLSYYSTETKDKKAFFDEEYRDGGFIIKKEITEGDYAKNIIWVKLSVYNQNSQLIKYQNFLFLSE